MIIKKKESYKEQKCNISKDQVKNSAFNNGEAVDITNAEYLFISDFRWFDIIEEKENGSSTESLSKKRTDRSASKIEGN